jgi:hypothetical protein
MLIPKISVVSAAGVLYAMTELDPRFIFIGEAVRLRNRAAGTHQ